MPKKILFITLSNIGDVVLSLPTLDYLREKYPGAEISLMLGPKAKDLFLNSPYVKNLIIYDKKSLLEEKIKLFFYLKRERFDIVVDLRNSLFGIFLPSEIRTSLFIPKEIKHSRFQHLYRIVRKKKLSESRRSSLYIPEEEKKYILDLLRKNNLKENEDFVIVAAGARSSLKCWDKEKFVSLITILIKELKIKVILVGDKYDVSISSYIKEKIPEVIDLTDKTTLLQLAELIRRAKLLIVNDSAVLHLGSYLNVPIVAIFGPTDDIKYGPWSDKAIIVKKEIFCRPCKKAECRFKSRKCMRLIKPEDVLLAVKKILSGEVPLIQPKQYKRILISRTDKIGDVVLSTPVIKAIRENYPCSYVAVMVSVATRELVEGNPYLDEVIVLDKKGEHKGLVGSLKFILELHRRHFDLALILHPTRRVHLLLFLSKIKRRIGYNSKWGFLLTDKLKHDKPEGNKHELEYNLDIVKYLGIEPKDKSLFVPIKKDAEDWCKRLFQEEKISSKEKLLVIHPSATCVSKRWPVERFAEVADKLIEKYNFRVVIVSGKKDVQFAIDMQKLMKYPAINLGGKISLAQLISLLYHSTILISNDSGPVHISSAVGTPVISIFGRNQKGLSPARWGPIGTKDIVLHKDIGCRECLAHNCKKGFLCLKTITVEEVLDCVDRLLKN